MMIYYQIYSSDHTMVMLDDISGGIYIIISHDIFSYVCSNGFITNNQYNSNCCCVKQFSIDDVKFNGQIYGRNRKDIFATVYDGIKHWNGTDLAYLLKFSNDFMYIPVPVIFDKDVFFCVYDGLNNVNMIAHGKLLE